MLTHVSLTQIGRENVNHSVEIRSLARGTKNCESNGGARPALHNGSAQRGRSAHSLAVYSDYGVTNGKTSRAGRASRIDLHHFYTFPAFLIENAQIRRTAPGGHGAGSQHN